MNVPSRILLIDDDPASNALCRIVISKTFKTPEIIAFTNPQVALEYIRSEYLLFSVPTVMFLDINMPVLNGWEVLDAFHYFPDSIKRDFTVFMLTSSIDMHDREMADENPNVWGYLEKPLTIQQLNDFFADIPNLGKEK